MAEVRLTKRIEFAAAHRYHHDGWDAATNRKVFGACNNVHGHGHNYLLEVSVRGEVDPENGMVVNLYDLKKVLEGVLEEFDHKHLNLDTPYFKNRIPTSENIALVLWHLLAGYPAIGRLERVRLYEDDDLNAEVTHELVERAAQHPVARLTKRYHFSAAHRVLNARLSEADNRRLFGQDSEPNGHNYVLAVTVSGEVDSDTGMITDIAALDQAVQDLVVRRFDRRDLNQDPDFRSLPTTGENLAVLIWNLLEKAVKKGRLEKIGLGQHRDLSYEYAGVTSDHVRA
jgi:6-pyruvoyltetrahydropterin/6-carboxytetrahydropterin synthase